MSSNKILYEIQKKLVETKQPFPTRYEKRKGKDVVTEVIYVTDVLAFMKYLRNNYTITPK